MIEILIFIVIIGIAASAILGIFASLTRSSASLIPEKQAQAIAAGMMNEILAQPFTFCDPDDPQASTATSAAGCTSWVENLGPETAPAPVETRGGATRPFDNVNDYHGYGPAAVSFPDNSAVAGLPGYIVRVAVASAGPVAGAPADATLHVIVTVIPPTGAPARFDGVRFRYAPNT